MAKVEANKTYVGVVEDNYDPKRLGRVKVRVLDVFDNLKVEDIPFATSWKDLNGNVVNIPEKGKVLLVVFDQGDEYKPEYISADHYNANLEKKLTSLSTSDYISMKSLLFDHKTQVYVNDKEGLKLDHKYNNVNITENSIDFNLKDNNRHVNIGDATAGQQAILGNHWMDWFDEFVDNLMGNNGGPYLGNLGAPVVTNPAMIQVLMKYKAKRDPVFLSHHVNIVDNDKVSTVRNTHREDNPQLGDAWNSTKVENNLTKKTNEDFKPVEGPKQEYDDKHVEPAINTPVTPVPPTGGTAAGGSTASAQVATATPSSPDTPVANTNPVKEPLSSPTSNPKIDKMIKFLKSKKYNVYEDKGILNLVSMQSVSKDSGEVSNKFDDTLYMFFKNESGNWELLEYQVTTMPGFVPKTSSLPDGVGMLALGQYVDQLKLDTYIVDGTTTPKKTDKCLKIGECVIHINDSTDKYNYKSNTIKAKSIVLIHRSSNGIADYVFNYSGGAHVFKNSTQYDQFIDFCDKQVKLSNKAVFTYTLCKQSEFDSFVPVDETETTKANNTTTELPNNPAINWEVGKTVDKGSLVDNKIRVDWIITNDTEPGHYKSRLDYGYISGTENVDVRDTYGQAWEIDEDIDSDRLVKILKFRAQEKFDNLKDS
jgi:hypothetical protein